MSSIRRSALAPRSEFAPLDAAFERQRTLLLASGTGISWIVYRRATFTAMPRPTPYSDVIIDPMNDAQVQHWAKDMHLQTYELRGAIKVVGPRLVDLRRYFGKSAHVIILENRKRGLTSLGPEG
jgi:hypothetical protein